MPTISERVFAFWHLFVNKYDKWTKEKNNIFAWKSGKI